MPIPITSMNAVSSSPRDIGWVIGQMLLLGTVAIVAPRCRSAKAPALVFAGGAALLGFAAWIGLGGVRSLGRNLTPLPAPREDGELVTSGIFAHVRHPLYASVMAMGFGWALLWGSRRRARAGGSAGDVSSRESSARGAPAPGARFLDYSDYAARVPRYLPRFLRRKKREGSERSR